MSSDYRAVVGRRPRLVELGSWWAGAISFWWFGYLIAEDTAYQIASIPQPDQAAWVLFFKLLPAVPLLVALTYAVFELARRRFWRRSALWCARIVLVGGFVVFCFAVPKPN